MVALNLKSIVLVLARDSLGVPEKIKELERLGFEYRIVCGEEIKDPNVIFRLPKGKFDAINYGARFLPDDVDLVIMNDVDTEIHNLFSAIEKFEDKNVGVVFSRVAVKVGPQKSFYKLLDRIRNVVPIAASGELFIIRKTILDEILPLKACKSEDSYLMFKALEKKSRVVFDSNSFVVTRRTSIPEEEEKYKRRTVGGLYQALSYSKPPALVRLFYLFLPFAAPLLLILGKNGYYWSRGIMFGYIDHLRGDKTGSWKQTY